jgi:hypothetical protein
LPDLVFFYSSFLYHPITILTKTYIQNTRSLSPFGMEKRGLIHRRIGWSPQPLTLGGRGGGAIFNFYLFVAHDLKIITNPNIFIMNIFRYLHIAHLREGGVVTGMP